MNNGLGLLMAAFSVMGIVVSVIQTKTFVAKTRKSMRIEKREVFQTARWIVGSGLCTGFFMALTLVLIMRDNQDVTLSAWGTATMLVVITFVGTMLIVGGFLLELLQLKVFVLPALQEQAGENSSAQTMDPNSE